MQLCPPPLSPLCVSVQICVKLLQVSSPELNQVCQLARLRGHQVPCHPADTLAAALTSLSCLSFLSTVLHLPQY